MAVIVLEREFVFKQLFTNLNAFSPIEDKVQDNPDRYWSNAPPLACPNNNGAYLHIVINEFDFAILEDPDIVEEISGYYIYVPEEHEGSPIFVRGPHGSTIPYYRFEIFVNRALYSEIGDKSSAEWHEAMTNRTLGIAHELLIAQDFHAEIRQVAEGRYPYLRKAPPVFHQEVAAVCSYKSIREELRFFWEREQLTGLSEDEIRCFLTSDYGRRYMEIWHEKRNVPEHLIRNRTIAFSRSQDRTPGDDCWPLCGHDNENLSDCANGCIKI